MLQLGSLAFRRYRPSLSKREAYNLVATRAHVTGEMLEKKRTLYKLYLDQCSSGVS